MGVRDYENVGRQQQMAAWTAHDLAASMVAWMVAGWAAWMVVDLAVGWMVGCSWVRVVPKAASMVRDSPVVMAAGLAASMAVRLIVAMAAQMVAWMVRDWPAVRAGVTAAAMGRTSWEEERRMPPK